MKKLNLKYIVLSLTVLFFCACEDDEPISAGMGDPANATVVNLEGTITPDLLVVGEGNVIGFEVTLPNSFTSDATVSARIELDNGTSSIGTATVEAGATTGRGTITIPADDDVITGDTIGGVSNAAEISLVAILLEELVPNTTYTITSPIVDLGIYSDTLPADSGLNILFDWEDPANNDFDLFAFPITGGTSIEGSGTGSRFEGFLFQNAGRADAEYIIAYEIFGTPPANDVGYELLFTLPDGSLEILSGTIAAGTPADSVLALAIFEKSTDPVSGEVSYINIRLF